MAKLSIEQIKGELAKKNFTLIDATGYENLESFITIQCPKQHITQTNLKSFRHDSYKCPCCDKAIDFINPSDVPQKGKKYRLIAFDQATQKFGLSIFDDGELVYYKLFTFSGSAVNRMVKIRKIIDEIVIKQWKPDYIVFEDIQGQQNGYITFKTLAMLLGVVSEVCQANDVPYECVSPNVWRKYAGTCGKTREEEKILSIAVVKNKYNIKVTDDVAEAILIGRYGCAMHYDVGKIAFGK